MACRKLDLLYEKFNDHAQELCHGCYRQNLHAAMLISDAEELNQIYQSSSANSPPRLLVTRIAARHILHAAIDNVTGHIADKTSES